MWLLSLYMPVYTEIKVKKQSKMIIQTEQYTPGYDRSQLADELQGMVAVPKGAWEPPKAMATTREIYSIAATIQDHNLPAIAANYRALADLEDAQDPDTPVGDEFVVLRQEDATFLRKMGEVTVGIEIATVTKLPTGSDLTLDKVERPFSFGVESDGLDEGVLENIETASRLASLHIIRQKVIAPAANLVRKVVRLAA